MMINVANPIYNTRNPIIKKHQGKSILDVFFVFHRIGIDA